MELTAKVEVFAQEYRTLTERLRTAASPREKATIQACLNAVYRRLRYYRGRSRQFNLDPDLFASLPTTLQL